LTAGLRKNRATGVYVGQIGAWIVIAPGGDHPLLALVETAVGPERFMTPHERLVMDHLRTRARERFD
jgi:hypothetical protein